MGNIYSIARMNIKNLDLSRFRFSFILLILLFASYTSYSQCDPGEDSTPPTAVCADVTLDVEADGMGEIDGFMLDGGSSDNCPGSLAFTPDTTVFSCVDVGTTMDVVLTVQDLQGNTSTCVSMVTIQDVLPPTAVCMDATVTLDGSGMGSITPADVDGGSSDNCGAGLVLSVAPDMFDCTDAGTTTTVTLTATDASGNSSTCTADVLVEDTTPPTAVCMDATVTLDGTGMGSITPADVDGGSTDNCTANMMLSVAPSTFTCADVGANIVTLTVGDGSNSSTCTATVTVVDDEDPTITGCPADIVQSNDPGVCDADVTWTPPTASDNCGIASLTSTHMPGDNFPVGTTTVVYTATDDNGNTSTCSFDVTVNDDEAPTVTCGPDVTIGTSTNGTGDCTGDDATDEFTLFDNCPPTTLTRVVVDNGGVIIHDNTTGVANGTYTLAIDFPLGVNTITYSIIDLAGNPGTPCSMTVTVVDDEDPVAVCQDITVELDGAGSATIMPTEVDGGSTDNCNFIVPTVAPSTFTCADVGANVVTLTVTDDAGNTDSCTATVTVEDNEDPTISGCPGNISMDNDPGACDADVSWTPPTASDNCGIASFTSTHMPGDNFPVGTTTVVYTATDVNGNTSTCSFDVTVNDVEPPVAVCALITIDIDPAGTVTITGADVDGGSSDNCGFTLSVDPSMFDCDDLGSNDYTLTVTDDSGNTATCTGTVTIEDNVLPTALCMDITIELDENGEYTLTPDEINDGSSDGCGNILIGFLPPGTTEIMYDCDDEGDTNTVTLEVTDMAGNTATCSAQVTIAVSPPVAMCMDITLELDDAGMVTLTADQINDGSYDNCSDVLLGFPNGVTQIDYDCDDIEDDVVTLEVTDMDGNVSACTSTVIVVDNEDPTITCPTDIVVDNDPGVCGAVVEYTVTADDNCEFTVTQTAGLPSGSEFPVGTTINEFLVTDDSGNTATCSFTVTVNDVEDPTITCPTDIEVDNDPGVCGAVVDYTVTADDNCGFTVTQTGGLPSGSEFPVGTTTNEFLVTDDSGNTATCSFDVTVNDVEDPVITCPADVTLDNDPGVCGAVYEYEIDATDNCPLPSGGGPVTLYSVSRSGNLLRTIDPSDGSTLGSISMTIAGGTVIGGNGLATDPTTQVLWAVLRTTLPGGRHLVTVDPGTGVATLIGSTGESFAGLAFDAAGTLYGVTGDGSSTSESLFTLSKIDATPTFVCALGNGSDGETIGYNPNDGLIYHASGHVGAGVIFETIDNQGIDPCGVTDIEITGTALDDEEAQALTWDAANGVFLWKQNHSTGPLFAVSPDVSSITLLGGMDHQAKGLAFVGSLGPVVQTAGLPSGSVFPVGTTTNTFIVTDASGNTATCSFDVTVNDVEDPVLTCPGDMTVDTDPGVCEAVVDYTVTATDNCDVTLVQTAGLPSGSVFPRGTTTNTFVATDPSGNSVTCTFDITVEDNEDPVITCPDDIVIDLPPVSPCCVEVEYEVDATDNCEVTVEQVLGNPSGSEFCIGTTTNLFLATDDSGNAATCSFTVTVNETPCEMLCPAPEITVSADEFSDCSAYVTVPQPIPVGNCDLSTLTNDYNGTADASDVYPIGTTVVTYTMMSICGMTTTCTVTITVVDETPPVFTSCPSDMTIDLDAGECGAVFSFEIEAVDECNIIDFSFHQNGGLTMDPSNFTTNGVNVAGGGVVCGFTTEVVGYGRLFDLDALGVAPTAAFSVTSVDFVLNFSSPSVPNTVSIYSFPAGTTIPTMANQTLLGTGVVSPPVSGANQLVTVNFINPLVVPAGEELFVTWEAVSNVFGGGSILASEGGPFGGPPETAPSYVFGCPSLGLFPDYTDVDGFFPGYSAMIQVNGSTLDPTVPTVPDPGNQFATGDMLPIGGPYCFAYTATDLSGNVSTCEFCITVNEYPEDLQETSLTCNDGINFSLDENCNLDLTADLILEGGLYGCYDTYTVTVVDPWGQPVDADLSTPGAQIGSDNLGMTLTATVTDNDTGNQCWGTFTVEDKQIPPLECTSLTVPCETDPVPGSNYQDILDPAYSQASNACTASCNDIDNGYSILLNPDRTVMDDMAVPAGTTWDVKKVRIVLTTAPWAPTGLTISFRQDAGGSPGAVFATQDISAADIIFVDTGDNSFGFDWYSAEATITPVSLAGGSSYWVEVGVFETSSNYFWESKNSPINGSEAWVDYSDFGGLQPASNIFGVQADMVFDIAIAVDATIEFPIPDGATYTPTNFPDNFTGPWTVYNYDPCGTVQLEYYDTFSTEDCDGEFARTMYRTWTAEDESGNTTTCVDTFNFRLPTILDVVFPADRDGLEDNEPALSCDGNYATDDDGHPSPSVTGYPSGAGCFNIGVAYDDIVIPICDGSASSYKILRQWVVVDWCTGDVANHDQIIKVLDQDAPDVEAADVTVTTGVWNCSYELNAEDIGIVVTDNCDADPQVNLFPAEGTYLTKGPNDILIQAQDACGNLTEVTITVFVIDEIPPVVIVDDELNVTLTNDGTATVDAESFDEGSYDVCGPVNIEVRRIGTNPCVLSTQYGDYVEFCCEDVALSPVIVEFRATDHSGNSNTGWTYVTVEDKLPPAIVCPGDITMNCLDNYQAILDAAGTPVEDLPAEVSLLLGNPQWGSACGNEVSYTAFANVDECGEGFVNVTWIINTDSGQSNGCLQRVFVVKESQNTLECDDITFPSGSAEANTYGPYPFCEVNDNQNDNDDDQPAVQVTDCGEAMITAPVLDNDQLCTAIGISMDADTFNFAEGACMKIVVHWEVIDHCVFEENYVDPVTGEIDPFNSDNGYFEFFAEYDIFDTEGPETECIEDFVVNCTETFSGPVNLNATDNCSDPSVFGYAWQFDIGNDGTVDGQGGGGDIFAGDLGLSYFPFGEHRVIWNVNDGCGNLSNETCVFTISQDDSKAPTAYCYDGLSTAVMAEAGTVTLWAVDFDAGSFDDCDDEVTITMIPEQDAEGLDADDAWAASEDGWTFDCSYIPSGVTVTMEVRIYATDNEGNYDYCSATLRIEDNLDACPDDDGTTSEVAGRMATETGLDIESAEVSLTADVTGYPKFEMTDGAGNYEFADNPMYYNYQIRSTRDFGYLDGVSTLDLVYIQRYVLGQHEFDSAYKVIASDINNDEKVSALDLLQLRKLILGLYPGDDLPDNESWRFVDADQEFADINDPWPFDEIVDITELDQDMMSEHMIGVKIGDVNESVVPNGMQSSEVRTGEKLTLEVMESDFEAGEEIRIDFTSSDFEEVAGYQFTISYDRGAMSFARIETGALEISESNFGMNRLEEGLITTSWNDLNGKTVGKDEVIFSLIFTANEASQVSQVIEINSRITKAEAYRGSSLEELGMELVFRTDIGVISSDLIELYQNEPNPFNEMTVIGFNLPEGGNAKVTIYDLTGKVLKVIDQEYESGYNSISISQTEIGTSGVLYYQLESGEFNATRKMIILE